MLDILDRAERVCPWVEPVVVLGLVGASPADCFLCQIANERAPKGVERSRGTSPDESNTLTRIEELT